MPSVDKNVSGMLKNEIKNVAEIYVALVLSHLLSVAPTCTSSKNRFFATLNPITLGIWRCISTETEMLLLK